MKIYFMGVCGTAMGNAALLARAAGHDVLGSDVGVYPPMSHVLAAAGIAVHEGYDPIRQVLINSLVNVYGPRIRDGAWPLLVLALAVGMVLFLRMRRRAGA